MPNGYTFTAARKGLGQFSPHDKNEGRSCYASQTQHTVCIHTPACRVQIWDHGQSQQQDSIQCSRRHNRHKFLLTAIMNPAYTLNNPCVLDLHDIL